MVGLLLSWLMVMPGYIANYGYTDGSGEYYIVIDTDRCDGCGRCVEACPQNVLEVIVDDYDETVAKVQDEEARNIKYLCGPCKPVSGERDLRCMFACERGAITHSW